MTKRKNVDMNPALMRTQIEADALGLSFVSLLTADVVRFRSLADAAVPQLTEWQWSLLSRVLDDVEPQRILAGIDDLPDGATIAAYIDSWADSATGDDASKARDLRRQAASWPPLTVAGALFHLRTEAARKLAAQQGDRGSSAP